MKNVKRTLIISIIVAFNIILGTTFSFAKTATVNVEQCIVREGPSTSTQIVTGINNGIEVEILGEEEGFYKIKYNNQEGYVRSDLLTIKEEKTVTNEVSENVNKTVETLNENTTIETTTTTNTTEETTTTTEVSEYPKEMNLTNNVKVYILPVISSTVITTIESGNLIIINKVLNNWSYITYENVRGWVRNFNLTNAITIKNEEEQTEKSENTLEFSKGYINASSVNVRETPSTEAKILVTLIRNTEIKINGIEGEWYKVTYGDVNGYISKELVSDTEIQTTSRQEEGFRDMVTVETKDGYICVEIANIRKTALTNSEVITRLNKKDKIQIAGEEGEFYKVILDNGTTAYIAKRLIVNSLDEIVEEEVCTNDTIVTSVVGSPSGEAIVAFAKQYLGYDYVYGGAKPETGFDCSGFVSYVFNSCGHSLSRTCSTQLNEGTYVEKSDLQLGDLIFFNNTANGSVGHVAIYIGDGRIIHAVNSARDVDTDTINSGYYYTYYYEARRVL